MPLKKAVRGRKEPKASRPYMPGLWSARREGWHGIAALELGKRALDERAQLLGGDNAA